MYIGIAHPSDGTSPPPDPATGVAVGIGNSLVVPFTYFCPGSSCVPPGQSYGFQQLTGTYTADGQDEGLSINSYLGPGELNTLLVDEVTLTLVTPPPPAS